MSAVDLVSQIPFNDIDYFILLEEIKLTKMIRAELKHEMRPWSITSDVG